MGTQFSSRLTRPDTAQVVSRLLLLQQKEAKAGHGGVESLPRGERLKLADAMIREILTVAEERHFFREFAASEVFREVLDWLKSMHTDAVFNGCRQTMVRYDLESHTRPIPVLARALREITGAAAYLRDPFRVSTSAAAQGLLAAVAARPLADASELPESRRFCKRLASYSLEDLVGLFVRLLVNDVLERIMHRADPRHEEPAVEDARRLKNDSAERIGRTVVSRVKKAGALADSARVREIVQDVLEELLGTAAQP